MDDHIKEAVESIMNTLLEALAINQCAEDAAKEEHVKTALGLVNGYLLDVAGELDSLK